MKHEAEKMSTIFISGDLPQFSLEKLAKECRTIYIINRDSPESLGGAMVSLYVEIPQDTFGRTKFGLLPMLYEITTVLTENGRYMFGSWGMEDTFTAMGHAVNCALEIALEQKFKFGEFDRDDCDIYVINENGTSESTMCSVYSYMAERGFPF